MFAKRLKAIDNDVKLDILAGLPHGFLNFVSVGAWSVGVLRAVF